MLRVIMKNLKNKQKPDPLSGVRMHANHNNNDDGTLKLTVL